MRKSRKPLPTSKARLTGRRSLPTRPTTLKRPTSASSPLASPSKTSADSTSPTSTSTVRTRGGRQSSASSSRLAQLRQQRAVGAPALEEEAVVPRPNGHGAAHLPSVETVAEGAAGRQRRDIR